MTWVRGYPVLCARTAQIFGGKENKNNMKRQRPLLLTPEMRWLLLSHNCSCHRAVYFNPNPNPNPIFWWQQPFHMRLAILCHQYFGGSSHSKRQNGVQAAYDAILLRALQVAFGYAAIINTSKEVYPWPLLFFATAIWLVSLKRPNTLK